MYSTKTVNQFTVITPQSVYRVKASNEAQVIAACSEAGINVLGIERDSE
jgi:hypothetical protein